MSAARLVVLYPHPTDVDAFERDYAEHLKLVHEKTGIPAEQKPYMVVKFAPGPDGPAPYHQMFSLPFPSPQAMEAALASPELQAVAAHATQISTGGPPVILLGVE